MSDNHPATPDAENIVTLADQIVREGEANHTEIERKRAIALRAFKITADQIEADALRLEEAAIVGEHPLMKRHQLMEQARALRMTHGWLLGLVTPSEQEKDNES